MVTKKEQLEQIVLLPMDKIREPKYRARHNFDKEAMKELETSIEQNGLIQAIAVKTVRGGYEIIAGERRFLAHKNLKKKEIKAVIKQGTIKDFELIKLDENLKRADLTDIEEMYSLLQLKEKFGMKIAEIAKKIAKSEAYVLQKLAIAKYPDYLRNALQDNLITFSAARELIRITDPLVLKEYTYHAVNSGITPKVAKQWADDWTFNNKKDQNSGEENGAERKNVEVEKPQFPCFVCSKMDVAENSSLVRVCPDCLKTMRNSLKL